MKAGEFPVKVRTLIIEREAYNCAACGRSVLSTRYSIQHRRARGLGGSRQLSTVQASNGLLVCGSATSPGGCHLAIESHPAWALSKGYRVGQNADPATVPVWVARQGWVYLTPDGFYLPAKDPHPDETAVLDVIHESLHGLEAS